MIEDMFAGGALAAAWARVMSQSGAAMLLPLIGGRLAEPGVTLSDLV